MLLSEHEGMRFIQVLPMPLNPEPSSAGGMSVLPMLVLQMYCKAHPTQAARACYHTDPVLSVCTWRRNAYPGEGDFLQEASSAFCIWGGLSCLLHKQTRVLVPEFVKGFLEDQLLSLYSTLQHFPIPQKTKYLAAN